MNQNGQITSRRHFLSHAALGGASLLGASQFLSHLRANAAQVRRNEKACILVWLGGGAPTIDMWDLKPGSSNGGEFKPISTAVPDVQVSELLPEMAKLMNKVSLVRSMSTREADHQRGTYYMHTAFVPNPTVVHPTFGSVVSHELAPQRRELEIPAFVSIGGGSASPGYLGMSHAPFVVDRRGQIQNANMQNVDMQRLDQRLSMLDVIETGFINSNRGDLGQAHRDVYGKAVQLMRSEQMQAFRTDREPAEIRELYGNDDFGNSLLMARRLVQTGVPFIEVQFPGGWDLHQNNFNTLRQTNLPRLDKGLSGLIRDLEQQGLLDHTVVVCMGEFGRTPRINQNAGRDHWATSWSLLVGGGGIPGGRVIGSTDADGVRVIGESYLPGDLWATVAKALGIPLDTMHYSKRGRPMRIANGGQPIPGLIG